MASFSGATAAQSFGAQAGAYLADGDLDGVGFIEPIEGGEPDVAPASELVLRGNGGFQGGWLRIDVLLESTRLGAGASLFAVNDVAVGSRGNLPWGVSLRTHSIWGLGYELFVGQEIAQGPVYPYIDLRATAHVIQARVEVHADPYGHVATSPYSTLLFGLGPRFGALVPIGHSTMLDVSITHRLVGGAEQIGLWLGLGYWNNDRRDPFSDELRGSWRGDF